MHICYIYIYIGSRLKGETCSHPTNMWLCLKRSPQKKKHQMRCITTCIDNSILQTKRTSPKSIRLRLYGDFFVKKPNRLTKSVGTDLSTPSHIRPPFLLPWPWTVCYKSAAKKNGSWYEKLTGRYIKLVFNQATGFWFLLVKNHHFCSEKNDEKLW